MTETVNGILSIDMHPLGYLAAGTETGDIIIFDSVDGVYRGDGIIVTP